MQNTKKQTTALKVKKTYLLKMSGEVSVEQKSSYTAFLTKRIPCNPTFDAKKTPETASHSGAIVLNFTIRTSILFTQQTITNCKRYNLRATLSCR